MREAQWELVLLRQKPGPVLYTAGIKLWREHLCQAFKERWGQRRSEAGQGGSPKGTPVITLHGPQGTLHWDSKLSPWALEPGCPDLNASSCFVEKRLWASLLNSLSLLSPFHEVGVTGPHCAWLLGGQMRHHAWDRATWSLAHGRLSFRQLRSYY